MTNEIKLNNEEVIDVAEDMIASGTNNGFAIGVGVGLVTGAVARYAYRHVVKPILTKRKAKKELDDIIEHEENDTEFDD